MLQHRISLLALLMQAAIANVISSRHAQTSLNSLGDKAARKLLNSRQSARNDAIELTLGKEDLTMSLGDIDPRFTVIPVPCPIQPLDTISSYMSMIYLLVRQANSPMFSILNGDTVIAPNYEDVELHYYGLDAAGKTSSIVQRYVIWAIFYHAQAIIHPQSLSTARYVLYWSGQVVGILEFAKGSGNRALSASAPANASSGNVPGLQSVVADAVLEDQSNSATHTQNNPVSSVDKLADRSPTVEYSWSIDRRLSITTFFAPIVEALVAMASEHQPKDQVAMSSTRVRIPPTANAYLYMADRRPLEGRQPPLTYAWMAWMLGRIGYEGAKKGRRLGFLTELVATMTWTLGDVKTEIGTIVISDRRTPPERDGSVTQVS